MTLTDDTIVRIIDRRTGKPLGGNRGRPMTYRGFLNHLPGYRRTVTTAFRDRPGGKHSSPEHWVLEVYEKVGEISVSSIPKKEPKAKKPGRKRKLDTPEEIADVCYRYYLTESSVNQIAQSLRVSTGVVDRVLKEHGYDYRQAHKQDIFEYNQRRHK